MVRQEVTVKAEPRPLVEVVADVERAVNKAVTGRSETAREAVDRRERNARALRRTKRHRAILVAVVTFALLHLFVYLTTLPNAHSWDVIVGLWVLAGVVATVFLWPDVYMNRPGAVDRSE
jgi:cation transport ATPase